MFSFHCKLLIYEHNFWNTLIFKVIQILMTVQTPLYSCVFVQRLIDSAMSSNRTPRVRSVTTVL